MTDETAPAPWDYWRNFPQGNVGEDFDPGGPAPPEELPPPVVTVFGAGIAGLSAAHELVERGFRVQVVERTESTTDEYECRVGGMASNQLSRVLADIETLHREALSATNLDLPKLRALRARYMQPTQPRFPITQRIRFVRGAGYDPEQPDDHLVPNQAKVGQVLELLRRALETYRREYEAAVKAVDATADPNTFINDRRTRCREILLVEIRGFTDGDETPEQNRALSQVWADQVKTALLDGNSADPFPMPDLDAHLTAVGLGDSAPLGDQNSERGRARSNRVEFRVIEQIIPGEHGFRFFPSCYRHLFDTMRRTPVLDKTGQETGETAFDQLVAVRDVTLAREDAKGPFGVNPRRIRSVKDFLILFGVVLRKLRFTDRDVLCLQVPMLKFLTSSRARREAECEDRSFWEYIGGDAIGFSPDAERFIKETPRALAAMSATETDARTQLTLLIQMMIKGPFDEIIDDFTLNGSSSDAWLRVWKTYLRRRGVRFFVGALEEVAPDLLPIVTGPADWTFPRPEDADESFIAPERTDFFVLAVSFEEASRVAWEAYGSVSAGLFAPAQFTGPFDQLRQFDVDAGRRKISGQQIPRARVPSTGKPSEARDPLRDISGIQYFFPNNYRIGHGHVYFIDSPWALTSISQLAYWRDRTRPIGSYIGQHSVDIGDWYKPFPQAADPTAWHAPRQQIAQNTWDQILASMKPMNAGIMLPPKYYHLDHGLLFNVLSDDGFVGNVVLHAAAAAAGSSYRVHVVTEEDGVPGPSFEIGYVVPPNRTTLDVADALRKKLAALGSSDVVFAVQDGDDVLVSPFCRPRPGGLIVAVRGDSTKPFYLATPTRMIELPPGMPGVSRNVASEINFAQAASGLPLTVTVIGPNSLRIVSPDPIAVANAENRIEIVDGPRLTIRVENRDVHVLSAPQRGSTRVTRVAVRGVARIRMSAPDPGRVYRVSFTASDGRAFERSYVGIVEPEQVFRDKFVQELLVEVHNLLGPAVLLDGVIDIRAIPLNGPAGFGFEIEVPVGSPFGPVYELVVKDLTVLALEELLPLYNTSPFLINVPKQWGFRPGLSRQPAPNDSIRAEPGERDEFDYAHAGALSRWVAAGTYMATFTRMTTMEAANESARHAVNAILQTIVRSQQMPPSFNSQGKLFGDPCEIWDPEENEPPDLEYFKRLDSALVEAGLPHFLEILRLGELVQRIPQDDGSRLELFDELVDLLLAAQSQFFGGAAATSGLSNPVLQDVMDQLAALTGTGGP